ncbi:MAG: rhomboid family intramembrane serine protease [Candidatus Woesearchaeota archaeon]
MAKEVEPDYRHAWKLLKDIILLPVTFVLIIFKTKDWEELFTPIKDVWEYFWDAKFTAILIILNIIISIGLMFFLGSMPQAQQEAFAKQYLLDGPAQLKSLNIIPFVVNWFVQLSWEHLFGNIVALFILGRVVEKNFGRLKFALIYFGSAIISGFVDDLVHIADLSYFANGASGAIAGLASAAMLIEPFYLVMLFIVPIPVFLFGWLQLYTDVTGVLNPTDAGVANFAHLGGFFAITILAFLMSSEEKSKLLRGLLINIVTFAVLAALWWYTKMSGA